MDADVPVAVRHDVVAGAGLRFRRCRELVLLALRSDVIDTYVNLVFLAPLVAQLGERVVCAGHPMVPTAQGKTAGGIDAADVRRGNDRC
jgi:hypothetical protein